MYYTFGDYVLDIQRHELHHAGEPIKLRRKVFQVLAYLLAHRERVVPKEELLAHLWPDQFVGDAALKSCITALRKALGEEGGRRAACVRCTARAIALWRRSRSGSTSRWTLRRPPCLYTGSRGSRTRPRYLCLPWPHRLLTHGASLWRRWTGNTNRSPCCVG